MNFDALVRHGMIDAADLDLFVFADDPAAALAILKERLAPEPQADAPGFAHSHHGRQGT